MNKDSKILITGNRGFVGKNLTKGLIDRGYTNLCFPGNGCDLREQDDVAHLFIKESPDYVFNLASRVGGIQANINKPFNFLLENLQIQNNMIGYSIRYGVEKFLNLGSSCIYPKDYRQPLNENDLLQAPLESTNEGYALAKICGLKLCEYANKQQSETKFISLMPCNLYGPHDKFDLEKSHALSALILKSYNAIKNNHDVSVWGAGNARREWMYVEDLVDCMIWSMENLDKTDTFLNVGTGQDTSMNELAEKIIYYMHLNLYGKSTSNTSIKNDPSKPEGMMKKCLEVSKINALGWTAKTSLDEGINKSVQWFLSNRKSI